jgi:hypothetical protein|tara:strand:+ start:805 stop:1161 length:357 start_codon:yes stop_codon:yes gene_type:complete
MAITNNQLTLTQLDAITVPASKQYAITNILVCNTYSPSGGSAATRGANFTMHLIPSGSALNNSVTTVVKELTLPAGETFTFDSERFIMEAGDKLSFTASPDQGSGNTDLAVTVSYMEV